MQYLEHWPQLLKNMALSSSTQQQQRQLKKDLVRVERQIQKAKEKIAELESEQEKAAFDPTELIRISAELETQRAERNSREEEWLEITLQLGL